MPAALHANGWTGVSWEPSEDDVHVAGYRVFQDGERVATVTELFYSNDLLEDGTYLFEVEAYDMAGHGYGRSEAVSLTVERPVLDCFGGSPFGSCTLAATPWFSLKPIGLGLLALLAAAARRRIKPSR